MRLAIFLVCSGIGYLLGHYLPDPWASYVSILVSYHLFLAFLLITAEHEPGFSFPPILSIVLTHTACLALLIGLAMGRRYVPILGLVRIFVPGLAPFECEWLFSAGKKKKVAAESEVTSQAGAKADVSVAASGTTAAESAPAVEAAPAYTFDDHDDWLRYLGQTKRPFRKPGLSVGDEFKLWREARARSRATASQTEGSN
jgi:hypothetical protein